MLSLDELGLKYGTDKASSGHNYLNIYEFFLRALKQEAFNFFEIGGLNGASLQMWAGYFTKASIVCIDIDPTVKQYVTDRVAVEIGDSGSANFLEGVVSKFGPPTVVLDDGSHRWDHQRVAFKSLFPLLEPGGWYIIEDLHTSFEPNFAGEDDHAFIEILHKLSDYLQLRAPRAEFERINNRKLVAIARQIESITFIARACIIKKNARPAPTS